MSAAERVAAVIRFHGHAGPALDAGRECCACGIDTADHADHVARIVAPLIEQAVADALGPVEALAEKWRYKGEFGWGAWQEGDGPDFEGYVLDAAATDLRAAIRAGREGAKS